MIKQPFYLFKRKLKKKSVWYWYTYDKKGHRTTPHSTGFTKKQEAFAYCVKLLQKQSFFYKKVTYGDFTKGIFLPDSEWVKQRNLLRPIKEATLKTYQINLNMSAKKFNDYYIDEITIKDLREYREELINNNIAKRYINTIFGVMKLIMNYAVEQEVISKTPFTKSFGTVSVNDKRDAFTQDEIYEVLGKKWDNKKAWLFVLTGVVTGMRLSEIRGLQMEQIKENYINIDRQFVFDKLTPPKTNVNRFVTIPEKLKKLLLSMVNNGDFIFSVNSSFKPMTKIMVKKHLYSNYTKEMKETQKERKLTFHSLRHFFNTYLISNGISETKVNFVIGHSSGKGSMLDLYTSWRPEMYNDVLQLQEELLDNILKKVPADYL